MIVKTKLIASAILCASTIALSACEDNTTQSPGSISEGEAQSLEEDARMLDERRLPEGTVPPVGPPTGSQEGEGADETSASE